MKLQTVLQTEPHMQKFCWGTLEKSLEEKPFLLYLMAFLSARMSSLLLYRSQSYFFRGVVDRNRHLVSRQGPGEPSAIIGGESQRTWAKLSAGFCEGCWYHMLIPVIVFCAVITDLGNKNFMHIKFLVFPIVFIEPQLELWSKQPVKTDPLLDKSWKLTLFQLLKPLNSQPSSPSVFGDCYQPCWGLFPPLLLSSDAWRLLYISFLVHAPRSLQLKDMNQWAKRLVITAVKTSFSWSSQPLTHTAL